MPVWFLYSVATPSSAPSGHLLPEGEGIHAYPRLRERVAEGRVRGFCDAATGSAIT